MDKLLCLMVGFSAGILVAAAFFRKPDRVERSITFYNDHNREGAFIDQLVRREEEKQRKAKDN